LKGAQGLEKESRVGRIWHAISRLTDNNFTNRALLPLLLSSDRPIIFIVSYYLFLLFYFVFCFVLFLFVVMADR
jgi:hypothetical protein